MTPDAGGRVGELRRRNTGLVIAALRGDGPMTRTDVARITGLAKATVGSIVADLETAGLVAETGAVTSGVGRPGRAIALTGTDVLGLGLEVNVDYVSTVLLDVGATIRHAETVPVGDREPLDVLLEVAARHADAARRDGSRLVGATVAVPGLVDASRTTVRWAPNLGWADVDLADQVGRATGLDACTVDNDANCAAVAERHHGVASDVDHVLYLTGTVGIGAGWILDGQLQRGADGFAGEVGHLPLGRPDTVCGCGRAGCWEASVGLRALITQTAVDTSDADPLTLAARVVELAHHDVAVQESLTEIGRWLGRGLAALTGVFDPRVVVLGGYFVPLQQWILPATEQSLEDHLSFADLGRPEIRLSTLGLQAAALGAASEALAHVLAGGSVAV